MQNISLNHGIQTDSYSLLSYHKFRKTCSGTGVTVYIIVYNFYPLFIIIGSNRSDVYEILFHQSKPL